MRKEFAGLCMELKNKPNSKFSPDLFVRDQAWWVEVGGRLWVGPKLVHKVFYVPQIPGCH